MRGREFSSWRKAREEGGEDGGRTRGRRSVIEECHMSDTARAFLLSVAELHSMSGRGIVRTLSVARTIADMAESSLVMEEHVAEAAGYRIRDGIGGC